MDAQAGRYPVSIKGVVVRSDRVLLLRNERQEWELPGGRLELGETPPQCVAREIAEETGWAVEAGPILDAWTYDIAQVQRHVFIVTYGCHLRPGQDDIEPVLSHEHKQVGLFTAAEVADLEMPQATGNRSPLGSSGWPPGRLAAVSPTIHRRRVPSA